MTKSSAHKATKKTRGTHRKTARKVGAGNAHSNDRKMAPKAVAQKRRKAVAEKARTTYRRTAVQFDQLAQTAQVPESIRALAEKSVAQNGGTIVLPRMPILGVAWLFYGKDTEGNIFGVSQSDPSAG